jgi:hypothetical protein
MFIFGILHLLLVAVLAGALWKRVPLLRRFPGVPGYLLALGLTLFLVNWIDFLLYALFGWGLTYLLLSSTVLLASVAGFTRAAFRSAQPGAVSLRSAAAVLAAASRPGRWFLLLMAIVVLRFDGGIVVTRNNGVWTNFNFPDTAFHLSVANTLANAPRFPPADLDVFPHPLKYHFLADFYVAHLGQLGLGPLSAIRLMNVLSAIVLVGALWSVFARWLRLPARWTALAAFIFLFLGTVFPNVIHYFAFRPPFFDPAHPVRGLLLFPFFNFESTLTNLLEPQRALLFSLPVVLLVLHAAFGEAESTSPNQGAVPALDRTLPAFFLVCLLPFSHIVSFAVTAACLLPQVWRDRRAMLSRWPWLLPALILCLFQLFYLGGFGPPAADEFAGFDVTDTLPLSPFAALPRPLQYVVFWFFADGDFLGWSLVFALPLFRRSRNPGDGSRLREFLWQWRWYFVVCTACFLWINFYRYSSDWGDSNKFVFFLNLGLTLVIVLGASRWIDRPLAWCSRSLWWFFFTLCLAVPLYQQVDTYLNPFNGVLLFHPNGIRAAEWLRRVTDSDDLILTAAYNKYHFVTPLAGRPTVEGIYSDSNPYGDKTIGELIRRVYEEGDLSLLPKLEVDYVCISNAERRRYKLHPKWKDLMRSGRGAVFHEGSPDDSFSVFVFAVDQLVPGGKGPSDHAKDRGDSP